MNLQFKSNIARLFVVAVLLSSLACSELPELARLMDNTANDFTPPSCVMDEIENAVGAKATATATALASHPSPHQNFSHIPRHTNPCHGSRDLLQLYSILRT